MVKQFGRMATVSVREALFPAGRRLWLTKSRPRSLSQESLPSYIKLSVQRERTLSVFSSQKRYRIQTFLKSVEAGVIQSTEALKITTVDVKDVNGVMDINISAE